MFRAPKCIAYDTPLGEVPIIFPNHVVRTHASSMLDMRS